VVSELWAIALGAAGETGLRLWPLLSVVELSTNLAITVIMIRWYTLVCSSLSRAKQMLCFKLLGCPCFWTFFWACVVCIWGGAYLWANTSVNTVDVQRVEFNPVASLSLSYYIINILLEIWCLALATMLCCDLGYKETTKRTAKKVWVLNFISTVDAFILVAVHIRSLEPIVVQYLSRNWHSWTLGALFFIRYVTVCLLIRPVTKCHVDDPSREQVEVKDTLHLGSRLRYNFRQGLAVVICNSNYADGTGHERLRNQSDADQYKLTLPIIGFEVMVHLDLTADQIISCMRNLASQANTKRVDGILVAFSGHGDQDSIFGVDGPEVSISKLKWESKESLDTKQPLPWIGLFDCCRGNGVESRRRRDNSLAFTLRIGCNTIGPSVNLDYLSCFATARGFLAYSNETGGGYFTRELCQKMEQLADEGEYDIEDALKMAGAAVAALKIHPRLCARECPTYESTLTRRFVLGRMPNNCLGTASGNIPPQRGSPSSDPLLHEREIELN